jgi:hypothetical protein
MRSEFEKKKINGLDLCKGKQYPFFINNNSFAYVVVLHSVQNCLCATEVKGDGHMVEFVLVVYHI